MPQHRLLLACFSLWQPGFCLMEIHLGRFSEQSGIGAGVFCDCLG
jgi:hypothetical protein